MKARGANLVALLLLATAACQSLGTAAGSGPAPKPMALEEDERSRELYLSIIGQLVQTQKYYAALAHIDEFERLYGKLPRSRKLRGDVWFELRNFANAEREYSALARGPLAAYGSHGLGRVEGARGNWTVATAHLRDAVHGQPTNTRFLTDLGAALLQIGEFDEAEIAMREALELSPMDEELMRELNSMLNQSRRLSEIAPTLSMAPRVDSEDNEQLETKGREAGATP